MDDIPPVNEAKCRRIFSYYDKDKDGRLTVKEFSDALFSLDYALDEVDMWSIVNAACGDTVTLREFVRAFERATAIFHRELALSFKVFDVNGDGYITFDELKEVMVNKFENKDVTDDDIRAMIKMADTAGNGRINYEAYERMFEDASLIAANLDRLTSLSPYLSK